jgi:hypothetical protein
MSLKLRTTPPKDFYLLTGYELRDGQVHLLDDTLPDHPLTCYAGTIETTLLSDIFNKFAASTSMEPLSLSS